MLRKSIPWNTCSTRLRGGGEGGDKGTSRKIATLQPVQRAARNNESNGGYGPGFARWPGEGIFRISTKHSGQRAPMSEQLRRGLAAGGRPGTERREIYTGG